MQNMWGHIIGLHGIKIAKNEQPNSENNGKYIPKSTIQWTVPQHIRSRSPCYKIDDSKKPDFDPYKKEQVMVNIHQVVTSDP